MRIRLVGVLPAVLLLAAGCGPDAPPPGLDGTWMGVRLVNGLGKNDDAFARTIRWTIAGDTILVTDAVSQEGLKGAFRVDDTKRPKWFNAGGEAGRGGLSWSGIYELEGDTLKVCYVVTSRGYLPRPEGFRAKPAILLTLKRVGT
jgi:uncharacterized protein (TIGR03067 family)